MAKQCSALLVQHRLRCGVWWCCTLTDGAPAEGGGGQVGQDGEDELVREHVHGSQPCACAVTIAGRGVGGRTGCSDGNAVGAEQLIPFGLHALRMRHGPADMLWLLQLCLEYTKQHVDAKLH